MFQKVHHKLTFLFTGITSCILIVMSLCYLYVSEQNLNNNQFISFQSDMNSIITNFEGQTVITHEWLSKMESGGKYQIYILDNNVEFLFQNKDQNSVKKLLFQDVLEYHNETYSTHTNSSPFLASHKEFKYTDKNTNLNYYATVANLQKEQGTLSFVLLFSLDQLESKITQQRIIFLVINMIAILTLFIFSYYFTRILLKPIEKNQKEQSAFISAASHELRTPLTVILSSASACSKAEKEEQTQFFHTIQMEGLRMANLIQNMLTLANADNHYWSIQMQKIEIDTLLLDTFEIFQPLAVQQKREMYIHLPEESIPYIKCDRERIVQVLAILITNALNYTNPKGVIHINLSKTEGYVEISVSDNGIGIPDSEKEHVFQRFYRIDSSRNKKDHFGLGLSIAFEIIKGHKGSIKITDTPGGGATFTIQLPIT